MSSTRLTAWTPTTRSGRDPRDPRHRLEGSFANQIHNVTSIMTGVSLGAENGLENGMFCESRGMPAPARNRMRTHRHLPLTVGQRFPRQTWLMPGLGSCEAIDGAHIDVGGCG
jgi:hypothetical protein